ncbi:unnamed protein product [Symbiodinium microadriaticum]|nr:unnamed protein product [Symbiodinium microadriaticum]
MSQRGPWTCGHCNIKVKATSNFCGQCGQGWSYTSNPSTATPWQAWGRTGWEGQDSPRNRPSWEAGKSAGKQTPGKKGRSPRRRPPKWDGSPRRRPPAKGQPPEPGKGTGDQASGKGKPPAAPSIQAIPAAPTAQALVPPSAPTSSASSATPEAALLSTMMGLMAQSREELPVALRELLDAQATEGHKNNKKAMHKLVSAQSTARMELERVRAARRDFLAQRSSYTATLCSLWEKQLLEKSEALQQFDDFEQQWSVQLQGATKDLAKMTTEGIDGVQVVTSSSEDDMETSELLADEEIQKAKRRDMHNKVLASEAQITQTLQVARQAAIDQESFYAEKEDRERSPRRRKEKRAAKEAKEKKDDEGKREQPESHPGREDDYVHPWLASTLGLRAAYEVGMENCGVFSTLRRDPREKADRLHTVPPLFQLAARHMDSQAAARADAKGVPGMLVSPALGEVVERRSCLKRPPCADRLSLTEFKDGSLSNLATPPAAPASYTSDVDYERVHAGSPASTDAIAILPEHLDEPGSRNQVISSFSWFAGFRATGSVAGLSQYDRYALFCIGAHARTRVLGRGWSLADVVADVRRLIPNLRNIRILLNRMANFPPVQVVATSADTPLPGHAVPLDLRPAGRRIFTTVLFPGMTSGEVEDRIARMCPTLRRPNQAFRLQLSDGLPFRAIPYQVLGPDYIRAVPRDALDWDPLHFASPSSYGPSGVVAEEEATALLQTAHAIQAGHSALKPLVGLCNPRSRRGGSLSNPTADRDCTPRGCWSGSLSTSTVGPGDFELPQACTLSRHVPPLWVSTALSYPEHQRLITPSAPSCQGELVGPSLPVLAPVASGCFTGVGPLGLRPCFSLADIEMFAVLSFVLPRGRWPAASLPCQAEISFPSGPAPGSSGYRPPPSLLSDLRDTISAQIPFRPTWMAGQQYHPPMDYACVSTPPPAQSARRYYTLFEPRLDRRQRSAPREWRFIDFITDAVREVQERVRLVYLVTRPMSGFAAPQLVLTLARAPAGCRSVPLDLRGIGGLVHTVEILFPSPATSVWEALHDKGLDATGDWAAAHAAGHLYLLDQDGREVTVGNTADGPEWAEFAARPGPWRHRRISFGSPTAADTATASTTSTTTAVVVERPPADQPPSLLGACLLRPSCPPSTATLPFQVYPEQLSSAQVLGLPAAQLCFYSGSCLDDQFRDFAVFSCKGPVGIHQAQADWTVEQYLQEAAAHAHTAARMVRFLSLPLPGLPTPQLTVTAATAGADQVSLPLDVRELGGGVITVNVDPGAPCGDLFEALLHAAPELTSVLQELLAVDGVFLQDELGQVWEQSPPDLTASQWEPVVTVAAAMPRAAATPHTLLVGFVVVDLPDVDRDVVVLQDQSLDGSLLVALTLDRDTQAEGLLAPAQVRRGLTAALNGSLLHGCRRTLITGDLIQLYQGPLAARVWTAAYLYQVLPELRLFAQPVRLPGLRNFVRGDMSYASRWNTRNFLFEAIGLRLLEQGLDLGEPGARSHPYLVLGPSHLPMLRYVPSDEAPSNEQVMRFLTYSGFFDPGTTFALTAAVSGTVLIAVSVPPRAHLLTVLYPAPDETPTMLQLSVDADCRLDTLQLPIRRGMELVFPRLTHAAVIRERIAAQSRPDQANPLPCRVEEFPVPHVEGHQVVPTPLGRRRLCGGSGKATGARQQTGDGDLHPPPGSRVTISLADGLPSPDTGIGFGLTPDMLDFLLQDHGLHNLTRDLPRHYTSSLMAHSFHTHKQAGWSVVALGPCSGRIVRIGFLCGTCPGLSAFDGELCALVHARAIALAHRPLPVAIASDCTSALQVAFGSADFGHKDASARALAGLALASTAFLQCVMPLHIRSHTGCVLNDIADALAKGAARGVIPVDTLMAAETFWAGVRERVCDWVWLLAPRYRSTQQLPSLSDTGTWTKAACEVLPRAPAQAMMSAGLQRCSAQLAFFQEAVGGCQIWLRRRATVVSNSRQEWGWDRSSFTILHASPQLLVATVSVGPFHFGLVSGHAPIADAAESVRDAWWSQLAAQVRRVPRGCILLVGVDANARFKHEAPFPSNALASTPVCCNAKALLGFAAEFDLVSQAPVSSTGRLLRTWTSPAGKDALIDYILCPSEWQAALTTLDTPDLQDQHQGFDHWPLLGKLQARAAGDFPAAVRSFCRRALCTEEGQRVAAAAIADLPQVSWDTDVSTHVQCFHQHLHARLVAGLPRLPAPARHPAVSEATLDLVRRHRHCRQILRAAAKCSRRTHLHALFSAWRSGAASVQQCRACGLADKRLSEACAATVRTGKLVRAAMLQDKAGFSRRQIASARGAGPAKFAHLLRAITRQGRRFKPPKLLPVLAKDGKEHVGVSAVTRVLGASYAAAERAVPTSPDRFLASCCKVRPLLETLDIARAPSVVDLVRGFLGLQGGRASGRSGLPAEVFTSNPVTAALAYGPIVLKLLARGVNPIQWSGGTAHSIPKGSKDPGTVQGWRAILLLETDAKAFQKAWRPSALGSLESVRAAGQHGGIPCHTLDQPSALVRAHLQGLSASGCSGGALFVDCASACYAIVRDFYCAGPHHSWSLEELTQRAELFFSETADQQAFLEEMQTGEWLRALQLPTELHRIILAQLQDTWYIDGSPGTTLYATNSGTAPGSPVADTLFAFLFSRFLSGMEALLRDSGTSPHIEVHRAQGQGAEAPTWADDVVVLFTAPGPREVEPILVTLGTQVVARLKSLGLAANLGAGKTEAIVSIKGHGSRGVRRHLLAKETPNLKRRAQLLYAAFKPVKNKTLAVGYST